MRRPRLIEALLLIGLLLVFGIGSGLTLWAQSRINTTLRYLSPEIGVWTLAEQGRESLRLRELVSRLSLGAPVEEDAYILQRDLLISRIRLHSDLVRGESDLFSTEQVFVPQIEALLQDYQRIEGGTFPTPETARQLLPILNQIATLSHDATNVRRDTAKQANVLTTQILKWMQQIQVGTLALLSIMGSALFWLTRKAFSNDLAVAYAEARQRSAELEVSQVQLQQAHHDLQQHNQELIQALSALEATTQERTALESTLQQVTFPIIPVLEGILVLPLIGNLNHERLQDVRMRVLAMVAQEQARVVIIDVTGVTTIDALIGQELLHMAQATELLGCLSIVVGITPRVAEGLLHVGFADGKVATRSTLQQGIEFALQRRNLSLYQRN